MLPYPISYVRMANVTTDSIHLSWFVAYCWIHMYSIYQFGSLDLIHKPWLSACLQNNVQFSTFHIIQKSSFFYEGIAKLEDRWNKCVMAEGEYFEKSWQFLTLTTITSCRNRASTEQPSYVYRCEDNAKTWTRVFSIEITSQWHMWHQAVCMKLVHCMIDCV